MEENKFLEMFRKHWSKFLLAFLMICCVIVWAERLLNSNKSHTRQDYMTVHQALGQFQKGEPFSIEALTELENILQRHPELHFQCDAMLAAIFCSQQNVTKGIVFGQSALENVKSDLPLHYQQYSLISLKIAEKKYVEALDEAKKLHDEIKTVKEYETLCGMNMIRILFLADILEQDLLKKQTWGEFKDHPSYKNLSTLFQEGSFGLADYFQS